MRKIMTWIAAAILLAAPGHAGDRPVVVELFTSQGCSSCPDADAFLHKLAARDDIVALALHVDYWDYIGWKDSFASPAYSARQRGYAKAGGRKMVYTPQMVINGSDHVVGNRPMDVTDLIDRHRSQPGTVALNISRAGEELRIAAEPTGNVKGPLVVQLIRYRPHSTVDIKRGENAGRTISYANVVTEMTELQTWDARGPLQIATPLNGDLPVVVLIQGDGHGPVAAVARLR